MKEEKGWGIWPWVIIGVVGVAATAAVFFGYKKPKRKKPKKGIIQPLVGPKAGNTS